MRPTPQLRRQLTGFVVVGALGTAAYLAVYVVLRTGIDAHLANVTARVAVAVPTTWVNGRRTFASDASLSRVCLGALAVLAVGTAISAIPLAAEQAWLGPDHRPAEVATLLAANAVATAVRFLLLRNWLFRPTATIHLPAAGVAHRGATPTSPTIQPAGS